MTIDHAASEFQRTHDLHRLLVPNNPRSVVCQAGGAQRAGSDWVSENVFVSHRSNDAQISVVEANVRALTQRIYAAAATHEALGRRDKAQSQPSLTQRPGPTIEFGTLRVVFGGSHGARIETAAGLAAYGSAPRHTEPRCALPSSDVRPAARTAVWDAIECGASVVRIDSARGAGATTLLHFLAAGAHDHGFAGGALLMTDVCGPASDIAQRLGALLDAGHKAKYYTRTELCGMFDGARSLILLDRANVTSADATELRQLFPSVCFVIVQKLALSQTPSIVLGPLRADGVLTLLEAGYAGQTDADNRRVALDICTNVGSLPGRTQLVGIAARELRRSFISLRVQCCSGDAIIGELIASVSAAEHRILGIMALAGAPLAAHHIAYVVRSGEIRAALKHLIECELIRVCGAQTYELPSYVEQLIPPVADADAAFARIVDVLCDVLDSSPVVPVLGRQLSAAERVLSNASERSQWEHVQALGLRLAETFATCGAFGAWGRVLGAVEAAATHVSDATALNLVRHELGVRAVLLGEHDTAMTYLRFAARERAAAGDEAGAAASAAVLALADYGFAEAGVASAHELPAESMSRNTHQAVLPPSRKPAAVLKLLLLGLGIVAVVMFAVSFRHTPGATPAIVQFTAFPLSIAGGRTAELCVDATDEAVVEIFPAANRMPGAGKHCLTVHPAATTTYIAVGTALDGQQVRRAVTITVRDTTSLQVHIAAFSASPSRIKVGQSTRLCYAVTDAHLLRIEPRVGKLTRLRSCATITLRRSHRYRYTLSATGRNGQVAVRDLHVDVIAAPLSPAARAAARNALNERWARHSIYQFDATPSVVERGQATSLCVGVERAARGFVTHVGPLTSGITRCYRVQPRATTVYRLYVAVHRATAVKTVTVAVRPPARRRDIARNEHR